MTVLSYFRAFVRTRTGIVVLSLALWLTQSLAELGPGIIIKGFFDALQQRAFAQVEQSVLLLLAFAAGFAGIVLATAVVSARLRFHVANALRRGVVEALLQREASARTHSLGAALATARDDPQVLAAAVATAVDQISILIFTTVALLLMTRIAPLITLIAIAPIAVVLVVSQLTRRRVDRCRTQSRRAAAEATGFLVNAVLAWKTIQLNSAQDAVTEHLARLDGEREKFAIRDQLLERSLAAAFAATSAIGSGLVLVAAGGAMGAGDFSIGDFALFAYYLTLLAEFSAEFGGLLLQYRQAKVSWRRILALSGSRHRRHWSATTRPFRDEEVSAAAGTEGLRELRLRDLRVRAPQVGDGINLTLRPGELVAVTGRVGAGKTTLLRALLGLVPVDSGDLLWNGTVVREPGGLFRFPNCAYVAQEPHLFSVSIRENVALAPHPTAGDADNGAVDAALQAAVLARDVAGLRQGMETVVGAAGAKLSGGQRQRLASARAFYHAAPVVVLDDPCSALDPDTEREYLRNVKQMARQGALCLVSGTSKALLTAADRIVVMRAGSVEAVGTLPELLNGPGEMSLLWGSL